MQKIGLLFGSEHTFPEAVITRINNLGKGKAYAEKIELGALLSNDDNDFNAILDLVSHEVPYYASYLKLAVMNGVRVINNPFIISPFEAFFNVALCDRLDIKMPRTAILPSKEMPPNTSASTLSNLEYPLDWEKVFDYVDFPGIMKPNKFDLSHSEITVYNRAEFFSAYDISGNKPFIFQQYIEFEKFYRTFIINKKHTVTLCYDPELPRHQRYIQPAEDISDIISKKTKDSAVKYSEASGLHFIAIDFGLINDELFAIDIHTPPVIIHKELPNGAYNEIVEITANALIELSQKPEEGSKKHEIASYFKS